MAQIDIPDPNDVIAREKFFKETATHFLSGLKLNLPPVSELKLRTVAEIENCNKAKKERMEDRKGKSSERIFKRKHKEGSNKVELNEFVGTKEFDKAAGNKKPSMGLTKFSKTPVKKNKRLGKGRRAEVKGRRSNKNK